MLSLGSEGFMNILERALGPERAPRAFKAFGGPASVSVRLNPAKVAESFAGKNFGPGIEKVPWSPCGYFLQERPQFTLDPLLHAGCYYVQDSSAMFVGSIFRDILPRYSGIERPLRVLDLCAAPGGKTTDLAASLRISRGDDFLLVANEVNHGRAVVLSDNVGIWGEPNVVVTSVDPKAFARMEGFFDIIVADVPCSGEGMFRKDPKSIESWSENVVGFCVSRQRRILTDAWPALRRGGILIYSTCTFEEAENDCNVEWAASELGGEIMPIDMPSGIIRTRTGALLVPGFVRGEGQFAAWMVKTSGNEYGRSSGGIEELKWLHPLREGLVTGTTKGNDFVPSADLATTAGMVKGINIPGFEYMDVEVDKPTALRYLHNDGIFIDGMPKGFLLIRYDGYPLGFVKNLGSRWNNLHPRGRRIRMDID